MRVYIVCNGVKTFIYQPATIYHALPSIWYLPSSLPMGFHKLGIYLFRQGKEASEKIIREHNELETKLDVAYTSSQTPKVILLLSSVANVCYIVKQVKWDGQH